MGVGRRVFIGVRVPVGIAEAIETMHEAVEPYFDGSFTRPQSLHVTLKFLGELDDETLRTVRGLLSNADFDPVHAMIDRYGTFVDRILWAHVTGIEQLQAQVDAALTDLYAPEQRFMGHLTIARMKRVRDAHRLSEVLAELDVSIPWQIHCLELIESKLDPFGAEYTTIERYRTHRALA